MGTHLVEQENIDPMSLEEVQEFLSNWSLGDYLRTKPPCHVVTLDHSMTIGQTLKLLATHNILSAPVFDCSTNQYLGFLDMNDLLRCLLSMVNVRELTEETRVYKLRTAGIRLEHQQLRNIPGGNDGALIYKAHLTSNMLEVVQHGFLEPGCHRVGVFECEDMDAADVDADAASDMDGASSTAGATGVPDVSCGIRITDIVSQFDILRFLHKHCARLAAPRRCSLEELGLAYKPVICVSADMPTISAFATMQANGVSAVGVVSHCQGGVLAANLSVSDLRGLLPQHFAVLAMPVLQFLTAKASIVGWPCQRQQGGAASAWGLKGAELLKAVRVVSCQPGDSLDSLLALMVRECVHRVYVVDGGGRPVGVVSTTDVLRRLLAGLRPVVLELPEGSGQVLEQQPLAT